MLTRGVRSWFSANIAKLPTGIKMLFVLTVGLFPLGLIAILASVESARDNTARRTEQTLARLEVKAQRLDALLARTEDTIRTGNAALSADPDNPKACENVLSLLTQRQSTPGSYALFAPGNALRCTSPGYVPAATGSGSGAESLVRISRDGETLLFAVFDKRGQFEGIAEFGREGLAELTFIPGTTPDFDLELRQGPDRMMLRDGFEAGPLLRPVQGVQSVADGQLELRILLGAEPIRAIEALLIMLPVMMWIGAAGIGWVIIDRLLLRPLARMERAISAYQPGDEHLDLPIVTTPAREIRELGLAFNTVTRTVARHEAELTSAIERQRRLVREVHHRVKNNLQVVASLLNLHARGATNEEVAAAYASIQRRVDALAVVHRNHYAELEENRGVALKPLISELGANLRGSAPATATQMIIRLDVEPLYVTQDVAVSVAFLLTEIIEMAMLHGAGSVTISLDRQDGHARLSIESDSLQGEMTRNHGAIERFDRIVTGLARQLRSVIDRDTLAGRISLPIAILEVSDVHGTTSQRA